MLTTDRFFNEILYDDPQSENICPGPHFEKKPIDLLLTGLKNAMSRPVEEPFDYKPFEVLGEEGTAGKRDIAYLKY